jgi:DNA-binding MarR family transcriptional regulator
MEEFQIKDTKTVPNQKIIRINREMPTSTEPFLSIKKEHMINAYKDLRQTAFVLYMYLACNKNNYQKAFSPKAVENELGMPPSTTRDQIEKLIEKGYLVRISEDSNIYDFYETPHIKS